MFLLSTFGGSSNIRDERAISETTFLLHKRPSCEHIPSHNIIWVVCFLLKYVLEPALSDAIKTLHPFSSLIQFWVVAFRLFQPQLEQGATHCGNIFWNGENLEFFYCVLRDQGGCKQPNLCLNPISLHFFKRRSPILGTHHCVSSPKNVNACNVKTSQSLVSSAGSTPISVCQNHNLIHHWSFKSASILIMSPVLWVKKCNVSLGEIT